MAAEKDIIVALELATTSIRAIAGQRMPDGTMQVLAFAEENASNCIRKGIIDNIDKTTQAISRVLGTISLRIGQDIARLYVGINGQSLHSVQNQIYRSFNEKTQITNTLIDQLMDTNRGVVYTDSEILEVIPQEYKVGSRVVPDIVGMQVETMEANFLNVIARNSLSENIEKCVKNAGFEIAELLITPLAIGESVLNAGEKRSGCALVDIGADTTTVSIYTNNILRKLVVIPLGSHNVTLDIANCLKIEAEEAEALKVKYGCAWFENHDTAQNNVLKLSLNREISESQLCEIAEARYEEILRNVWEQIKNENDKLTSGIVFTGGGAQIKFITEAFQQISNKSTQVRIVKGLPTDIFKSRNSEIPDNGRTNGILALLLQGDQNCVIKNQEPDPQGLPGDNGDGNDTPTEPQDDGNDSNGTSNPPENPDEGQKKKKNSWWDVFKKALTDDEDQVD